MFLSRYILDEINIWFCEGWTIKESWALKNGCFWTVVLNKTLESPLDCREIKPVSLKGSQFWIFTGRTIAEAESPIFWPPDAKNWFFGKDPDGGKDWRQEEKGTTEDEKVETWQTRWMWVLASSGSWWWTGKPVMLQSMGSQRVRHDWVTELKIDYPLYCEWASSNHLKALIEKHWPGGRGNLASSWPLYWNCVSSMGLQPAGLSFRFWTWITSLHKPIPKTLPLSLSVEPCLI